MLNENIVTLRRTRQWSQEQLAQKLGITRQTLSKWETGESAPDLQKARLLADTFGVSLDDLTGDDSRPGPDAGMPIGPKGKYAFGLVSVGDKGQIVIPAKARRIFGIEPGDRLMVLGDENQGLALISEKRLMHMVNLMHQLKEENE